MGEARDILQTVSRLLRYLWAGPTTLPGLALAGFACVTGGRARVHTGVVEAHGGCVTWLLRHAVPLRNGAAAMTLGHVVLGRDRHALARTRRHERVHVRQVERWGPLFYPAYATASVLAWWHGGHYYRDNAFEVEAYSAERRA